MFEKLLEYYKTVEWMAEYMGVSPQIVYVWKNRGYLPPNRAIQIEFMSQGEFMAVELIDSRLVNEWVLLSRD